MAGVVEEVGGQVERVNVGERVFVSPGISCWNCEFCLAGRDNMCRTYSLLGAKMHGGYAEYVKVPFRNVLPIPGQCTLRTGCGVSTRVRHGVAYAVCTGRSSSMAKLCS